MRAKLTISRQLTEEFVGLLESTAPKEFYQEYWASVSLVQSIDCLTSLELIEEKTGYQLAGFSE